MTSPFAKLHVFHSAPPAAPGMVIDSAHQFAHPQVGVGPAGDRLHSQEAALAVGIREPDLLFLAHRRKVRFLRVRENIYFCLPELREDLGLLTVPTARSGGGQRRGLPGRKTAA